MKIVHFLGWDNKCESPITYCVFHHISGHLPRQIKFWSILIKSWDWGKIPRKAEFLFYKLPLCQEEGIDKEGGLESLKLILMWIFASYCLCEWVS